MVPLYQCRTHSLPLQNELASLASHTITPLISCGLPILFMGFMLDHICSYSGWTSRYGLGNLCYPTDENEKLE